MSRRRPIAAVGAAALAVAAVAALAVLGSGAARGERSQHGSLIVSLDGGLSPLLLPRDHPAPVAVRLVGGLTSADRSLLPRVDRMELSLPGQGVVDVRGLARCSLQRLRNATADSALDACGAALVGHGRLEAEVRIPHQQPFAIDARLLAFNGRVGGRKAVILHGFSPHPPTVVVLPFSIKTDAGRLGTRLVADLQSSLGPWPRLARFQVRLFRRYRYRGSMHSYISASCPIPKQYTAGFFSFARASFTLAGGRTVATGIARSCRAR
jgi:hypothetical protein